MGPIGAPRVRARARETRRGRLGLRGLQGPRSSATSAPSVNRQLAGFAEKKSPRCRCCRVFLGSSVAHTYTHTHTHTHTPRVRHSYWKSWTVSRFSENCHCLSFANRSVRSRQTCLGFAVFAALLAGKPRLFAAWSRTFLPCSHFRVAGISRRRYRDMLCKFARLGKR